MVVVCMNLRIVLRFDQLETGNWKPGTFGTGIVFHGIFVVSLTCTVGLNNDLQPAGTVTQIKYYNVLCREIYCTP